ncbi:M56 family metallopeptidase [Algoriphagus sp.]|uniref:M56 family metallopeptidase n=1 Tax=Algoriphagus sp. TaxID=1872435 RepID=UPI0025EFE8C9|nr:M56 family metallopeptidase [Algoriphagus sp.]
MTYLLEGSLGILLVVLFYKVMMEGLTFFSWSRITLLGLLIGAVFLPMLSIDFQWLTESSLRPVNSSLLWVDGQLSNVVAAQELQAFNWFLIPLAIYVMGVVYSLSKLAFGVFKTFSLISSSERKSFEGFTIVINKKFIPASFFNYILLPDFQNNSSELSQIILHESVHIRKGHTWDVLFLQLVKSIFWFNPAVYLLEKQLREIHEFQADQEVTNTYSPIVYSRLLLKQLSQDCGLQFMNNFNQFQTKKRIIMMNKTKSKSIQKNKLLFSIPLMILMIGLFSCNMAISQADLTGTWKGTEFKFDQTEGPDLSAMIEGGRALHEGSNLALNEDGTVTISSAQGDVNGSGTWKFNDNQLIVDANGEETYYEIVSVTGKELVTKHEVGMDTPMGKLAGIITLTYVR